MKLKEDACHLIISGYRYEATWAKIGQTKVQESKNQKLLRVIFNIAL